MEKTLISMKIAALAYDARTELDTLENRMLNYWTSSRTCSKEKRELMAMVDLQRARWRAFLVAWRIAASIGPEDHQFPYIGRDFSAVLIEDREDQL